MRVATWPALSCLWVAAVVLSTPCRGNVAAAHDGMVATVHPLATDAGVSVLRRGGNAIDAAVAAAMMLGVVDGQNSGIGGGCLILIRRPDGKLLAIDGRETAPLKASRQMYLRQGKPQPELSRIGPLAVATPGALAAYEEALRCCGRFHLRDLLLPAAEVAQRGFPISAPYAEALSEEADGLAKDPGTRAVFFKADGLRYQEGEVLRQPDLAGTYRAIAAEGTAWFYRGPFARRVDRWMAEHGGVLSAADFAGYHARHREPVRSTYRGYTIVGFPPPSSGGIHVAQILNILEGFDLNALHRESPAGFYHVVAEAMKLAFADRAYWSGDSDFVDVPRGLVDKRYAATLAAQIDLARTIEVPGHGQPLWPAIRRTHHAHRRRRRPGQLGGHHGHHQHLVRLEGHCAGHRCDPEQRDGRLRHCPADGQRLRPAGRGSQRRGRRQAPAVEHEPDHRA
jgi:gamma-glutamyltranspeptidase/glutathione hydrolase